MKKPSLTIFFDKRNMKTDHFSVKWAVYYDNKQKYYASGIVLSKQEVEFLKKNKNGLSGKIKDEALRNLWNQIYGQTYFDEKTGTEKQSIISIGYHALEKIETFFSFDIFALAVAGKFNFEQDKAYPKDARLALIKRSELLEKENRPGSSDLFKYTAVSFTKFAVIKNYTTQKNPEIPFRIVTVQFLKEYEKWMLSSGKTVKIKGANQTKTVPASLTMIGIYCRNMRTVFNEAIAEKVVPQDIYPFNKTGFKIPSSRNKKKALDESALYSVFTFPCKINSLQDRGRDLWVMSYLCNGINMTDLCGLRRFEKDFQNGFIDIVREKTKSTTKEDQQKIRIILSSEVLTIIEKWGNSDKSEGAYLFPFLDGVVTERDKKKSILKIVKSVNFHMSTISKKLNLGFTIKTYEARHSFATTLLRSEAPMAFISQSLGHSNMSNTQKYLGSFEISKTREYLSALIPKAPEKQKPDQ